MAALRVRLLPGSRKRSSRCDRHRMRNCTPLLPPSILRLSRSKSLTRREFPGVCREIKNFLFFNTWNPDLPDSFLQPGALAQELVHTFHGIAIPDPHRVRRNPGDSCSRNAGLDEHRIIARNPGTGGRPPTHWPKKYERGGHPPSSSKAGGGYPPIRIAGNVPPISFLGSVKERESRRHVHTKWCENNCKSRLATHFCGGG